MPVIGREHPPHAFAVAALPNHPGKICIENDNSAARSHNSRQLGEGLIQLCNISIDLERARRDRIRRHLRAGSTRRPAPAEHCRNRRSAEPPAKSSDRSSRPRRHGPRNPPQPQARGEETRGRSPRRARSRRRVERPCGTLQCGSRRRQGWHRRPRSDERRSRQMRRWSTSLPPMAECSVLHRFVAFRSRSRRHPRLVGPVTEAGGQLRARWRIGSGFVPAISSTSLLRIARSKSAKLSAATRNAPGPPITNSS